MKNPGLLLATSLLITHFSAGWGCTSGSFSGPFGKSYVVSFRNLELPVVYFDTIAWVPAGASVSLLPVAAKKSSSLGTTYTVSNGFVCLTSANNVTKELVDAALNLTRLNKNRWPGSCTDGMNVKGLAISAQMQPASLIAGNRYKGSGPAVEQSDLVAYVLARYDNVSQVQQDLESGKLVPVINAKLEGMVRQLYNSSTAGLHFNMWDSNYKSLVIEFGPTLAWHDNSLYGSLANEPLFKDQLAFYSWWNSTYANPYTTSQGSLFFNMPGAFNSSFRFMRPAMLRGPGNVWKWPENGNLSPFYPTNQPGSPLPATNPTLVTAVKVLNTIYLPKGIDSSGGSAGPGTSVAGGRDLVWWTVLRDHTMATLYWNVANSPQWKRIDLTTVRWAALLAKGSIQYTLLQPAVWWQDETNSVFG